MPRFPFRATAKWSATFRVTCCGGRGLHTLTFTYYLTVFFLVPPHTSFIGFTFSIVDFWPDVRANTVRKEIRTFLPCSATNNKNVSTHKWKFFSAVISCKWNKEKTEKSNTRFLLIKFSSKTKKIYKIWMEGQNISFRFFVFKWDTKKKKRILSSMSISTKETTKSIMRIRMDHCHPEVASPNTPEKAANRQRTTKIITNSPNCFFYPL